MFALSSIASSFSLCLVVAINLLVRFVVTPVSLDLNLSFQDPLASTDLNDRTDRENDPTPDKSKLQNG